MHPFLPLILVMCFAGTGTWAASGINPDSPGSYSHDQDVPDILAREERNCLCECLVALGQAISCQGFVFFPSTGLPYTVCSYGQLIEEDFFFLNFINMSHQACLFEAVFIKKKPLDILMLVFL